MAPRPLCALSLLCHLLLLSAMVPEAVSGRVGLPGATAYPVGLSVAGGTGALGVRDEAISKQRYAGTQPYLAAAWAADHGRYIYRVGMEFRRSDRIRNHGVRTDITRFVLGQSFLYPLAPRTLAGRTIHLHAGPLTAISVYNNDQHIAVEALGFAQSIFVQLSLGARVDARLPLTSRVTGLASLRTSLVSLGIRGVDDEIDDASPAKLLLPWSGADLALETGLQHRLSNRVAITVTYLFQCTRIRPWNPLSMASDSIVGRITCRL